MANLAEIYTSLETVGALDGYPVILLLCISQYPTPTKDVNLQRLHTLQESFPMIPIGFSDHIALTPNSVFKKVGEMPN